MHSPTRQIAIAVGVLLSAPRVLYAAPETFAELVALIIELLTAVLPLIVGLILIAFLWGLAKFVFNLGSSENAAEGKTIMLWGVIALAVAVSVWGLVAILVNTFLG